MKTKTCFNSISTLVKTPPSGPYTNDVVDVASWILDIYLRRQLSITVEHLLTGDTNIIVESAYWSPAYYVCHSIRSSAYQMSPGLALENAILHCENIFCNSQPVPEETSITMWDEL